MAFLEKSSLTTELHFKVTLSPSSRSTWGFHHRKITPEATKSNSESERFMRTIQKTLRAAHLENKNWKQDLELFLFLQNYRATPHSTTGVSPCRAPLGTKINRQVTGSSPHVTITIAIRRYRSQKEGKMKEYADTATKAKTTQLSSW